MGGRAGGFPLLLQWVAKGSWNDTPFLFVHMFVLLHLYVVVSTQKRGREKGGKVLAMKSEINVQYQKRLQVRNT